MKTRTIGEVLREERQRHHVSVADLSSLTRIKQSYLEALEKNQFNKLPAATFIKGYIKTYAEVFGFDYEPLLALLRRDFKESAKGKLVPREFIKPVYGRQKNWTPITLVLVVVVGTFVALASYVGWQWYQLQRPPLLIVEQPVEEAVVSSRVEITGRTIEDGLVTVNNDPVAVQADGSFDTELYLPREGLNTITIEATDRRGKSNILLRSVRVAN